MANMSGHEPVIKCGVLIKRSVVKRKKRFAAQNYKSRYFELTPNVLSYYDGDLQNHEKLKGCVPLLSMKNVREVDDNRLEGMSNVFQIVYEDKKDYSTLYIVAKSNGERQAWLSAISDEATRSGAQFFDKYHPGVWTKKMGYYNCCDQFDRNAIGCKSDHFAQKNPPPPVPPPRPDLSTSRKQEYIALFDYDPPEDNDLELIQGEKYTILDKSFDNWWYAENREGKKGYIPANYIKINFGLEQYEWYYKDCTRERASHILLQSGKDGCFLVRDSLSNPGAYSLSIYTTEGNGNVRHYRIQSTEKEMFYVLASHSFKSIPELIYYHKHNAGGLYSRLREPPPRGTKPSTAGFSHDKWELNESKLEIGRELGRGCFGVVYEGTYLRGSTKTPVAIKEMFTAPQSDEFTQEVKPMTQLHHRNIVQLYGIIPSGTNPKIVTELLVHGALDSYLKNYKDVLYHHQGRLLDIALQVCCGMEYLNSHLIIHRDLAARNCLVGKDEVVKVADFGLAREVLMDHEYHMSTASKFPFKWSPPEVLHYRKYTSKSDVWSYGILLWEIYSFGEMPYQGLRNPEVTKLVAVERKRLSKPDAAPSPLYEIMMKCWKQEHEERPTFTVIKHKLEKLSGRGDYIPTEPCGF